MQRRKGTSKTLQQKAAKETSSGLERKKKKMGDRQVSEPLEPILTYGMNETEAKAFKVSLFWQELTYKEFPDYKHVKLRKSGDPRKSLLFKYCYKLINETKGLIPDKEYKLYVLAQLHVLKGCRDGEVHALIDPGCLVGPKAWIRWRMWKKKYDTLLAKRTQQNSKLDHVASFTQIKIELEQSQEFMIEKLGGIPTYEQVERTVRDGIMLKWVTFSRVTPYYVLLSPFLKKALEGQGFDEVFSFDLDVYRNSISEDVKKIFSDIFKHEFAR